MNEKKASDHEKWSAILKENESWIHQVLVNRLQSPGEVEEVSQEISLALMNSSQSPEQIENPTAWLYRVALRQVLMYRRKKGRYRALMKRHHESVSPDQPVNPLAMLMRSERAQTVRKVLRQLSDMDREILLLKYTENWTYQQLAEKIGVSRNTIEYRLLKAKRKLRQLLTNPDGEVAV